MSITPRLKCPPDYSILSFRYVECKKVGIVKGISKEVDVDLKDFFIPVSEYSERRITLKPGEVQRIDAGNLFNYGEQNETYYFEPDDLVNVASGTTHRIEIFSSEDGSLLYTTQFTFILDIPETPDFLTRFTSYYNSDETLQSYLSFAKDDIGKQSFTLANVKAGEKQLYRFTFNINSLQPYYHPGDLTIPYRKWDNGRLKIIFILAHIGDKFTLTNQKNFQWAFDDEYQSLIRPKKWNTKILTDAANDSDTLTWYDEFDNDGNLLTYEKRPAYQISEGSMIRTDKTNNSGYIQSITGYTITVDEGVGNSLPGQYIQKLYSPNAINWRTSGEMLSLSGGEEVNDTDKLNIETIWLKNNQTFDLSFEIILAS